MDIYQMSKDWFLARGRIGGKFCCGYGRTHTEAMMDAFKDYQVIINL